MLIGVHPGLNRCPFKNPKDPCPESPCCARLRDAARWCLRRFGALWCSLVLSAPGTRKKTRVSSKHRSLRNFCRKLCFTSLHSQPQPLGCISLLRFLRGSVLLFSCPRGLGPLLILFSFCRRSPPDQERSFQHKKKVNPSTQVFSAHPAPHSTSRINSATRRWDSKPSHQPFGEMKANYANVLFADIRSSMFWAVLLSRSFSIASTVLTSGTFLMILPKLRMRCANSHVDGS